MAKFKYIGPEMHVGRFGKLAPGTVVDLWQSEVEFIQSRPSPEWEDVSEENLEGVGTIVPARTGFGFDLTTINWLQESRASLRRLSRSELGEVANSMRNLGCHIPSEEETRDFSREALFETLYGEVKRLRWDQPGYQAVDRNVVPSYDLPVVTKTEESEDTEKVRAHNEDGTFKADDPNTPEVNEAYEERPLEAVRPVKKVKRPKN